MRSVSIQLLATGLAVSVVLPALGQAPQFGKFGRRPTNFTHDKFIVDLAIHGSDIWAATLGGVVRWDADTGAYEKFTRVADGLPEDVVTAIAVQSDGTVWVGTEDSGLGVFDPVARSWTTLDRGKSPLSDDLILAVRTGPDDAVWVGTFEGGLNRVTSDGWTVFDPNNSGLSDRLVSAVEVGPDGVVWASVFGDGLDRFDGTTWTNFNPVSTGTPPICSGGLSMDPNQLGLISFFTSVEAVDPVSGAVWVRNEDDGFCLLNGMSVFDGGSWRTFTQQNSGLHSNFIEAVAIDAEGDAWFGDFNGISERTPRGFVSHPGVALAIEPAGDAVVLAAPGGAARVTNGQVDRVYETDTLPDNVVTSIAVDPRDPAVRWLGTRSGAVRMSGTQMEVFDSANSPIVSGDVQAVAVDRHGVAWLGTRGQGVSRFDGVNWTTFTSSNSGLATNRVEAAAADGAGNVWFGGGLISGLSRWNGQAIEAFPEFFSIRVADIAIARNGDAWFATSAGAARFRDGSFTFLTTADGLPTNQIDSIDVAANGDVWMGTLSQGVVRYDGTAATHFTTADGLPSDSIRTIAVRSPGTVWVGTLNDGLARFHDGAWDTFDYDDGLVGDRVSDIVFDRFRNIWVGTEFGLTALHRGPKLKAGTPAVGRVRPGTGTASAPSEDVLGTLP